MSGLPPSPRQEPLAPLHREPPERRHRGWAAALSLRFTLAAFGVVEHIIPVMVGDPVKAKMIGDWLMDNHGIYVQPINYPTVPKGTERLRITPSPVHSDGDIDRLIEALSDIWSQCELARGSMAA